MAIFLPPFMVERNVWGSNLLTVLDATTGVVTSQGFPNVQKAIFDGRMNAEERREQVNFAGSDCDPLDEIR